MPDPNHFSSATGTPTRSALTSMTTPDPSPTRQFNPNVEGLTYTVYGASYEGADFNNTGPSTRYPQRVANRLAMTLVNRAVSGDETSDQYMNMSEKNSTRRLAPGTKGVIMISGSMNDALRNGMAANRDTTFKNNLKASIYRAFCSQIVQATDASIVYSGTGVPSNGWATGNTTVAGAFSAQMDFKLTNTTDATADWTVNAADVAVFTYDLCSPSYTVPAARMIVSVDSQVKVDRTPGFGVKSGSTAAWSVAGAVIPLVGLGAGSHTIRVQSKASAGQTGVIQCFGVIDRTALPQVLVTKPMYLDAARPPAGYSTTTLDAYRNYVDQVIAEVIAEIPEAANAITVVDAMAPDSLWNPATGIGGPGYVDTLHPNDLGESMLADIHMKRILELPWRRGMNK